VVVYRADEIEAARLHQLLSAHGVQAEIERFGPKVVYVTVNSTRSDLPALAKSAGRSVRRVYTLDELASPRLDG
jgi:KaiC/GvpD/RAD55 family RecA-like ATPase